jgi:hypothetical protein
MEARRRFGQRSCPLKIHEYERLGSPLNCRAGAGMRTQKVLLVVEDGLCWHERVCRFCLKLASHQKCICPEEGTGKLLRYAMTCYVIEVRDDVGWCKARSWII